MNGVELLAGLMTEAASEGAELVPEVLLALLAAQSEPLRALSDWDLEHEIFRAIETQFPSVSLMRAADRPAPPDEAARLAALLRWTIRELREWSRTDDPQLQKLTALLVITQFCDWSGTIWEVYPGDLSTNRELLSAVERIVAGLGVSFGTRHARPVPIWEAEAVQALQQADAKGDWASLATMWRQFEHAVMPGFVLTQSARFLARCDFDGLVRAVSGIDNTAAAMTVAHCLPLIALGAASENPFIQFAMAYQAGSRRPESEPLSNSERDDLTAILMKVASDETRWVKWMDAFNCWPARYPSLQPSLGRALALVPDGAVGPYVDAILLSPAVDAGGRDSVSTCLRDFRDAASIERRKLLWRRGFGRWRRWRFGANEHHAMFLDVGYSELDLAVVGYAIECLDDVQRNDVVAEALTRISVVDETWYPAVTDCYQAWNRALSELQPYVHAQKVVGTDLDWLPRSHRYLPFDPTVDRYIAMKFGMRAR